MWNSIKEKHQQLAYWLRSPDGRGFLLLGGVSLLVYLFLTVNPEPRRISATQGRERPAQTTQPPPRPAAGLYIRSATYGSNCNAPAGNATSKVAQSCSGKTSCDYIVD